MEITRNQAIESFLQNKEFQFKAKISENVYVSYNFKKAIVAGNTLLCKFVDKAGFVLNNNNEYEPSYDVINECVIIDESIKVDDPTLIGLQHFYLSLDEMDLFFTADHVVDPSTIPTAKITPEPAFKEPEIFMTIASKSQCAAGNNVLDIIEEYINFYNKEEFDAFCKAAMAISQDGDLERKDDICAGLGLGDLYGSTMNRLKRVLTGRGNIEPVPAKLTSLISLEFVIVDDTKQRLFKIK